MKYYLNKSIKYSDSHNTPEIFNKIQKSQKE